MLWVDEVATIAIVEFWDIVAVFFFLKLGLFLHDYTHYLQAD